MSGVDFLDSNVLIYLFDPVDAARREIARKLLARAHYDGSAIISFQVVQETLNVLTGKFRERMTQDDAREALMDILIPLCHVQPSAGLYAFALDIRERHRFSFHDSLIVAAALEAGCERLLSEDLQHGQRIESLVIIDPFLETA